MDPVREHRSKTQRRGRKNPGPIGYQTHEVKRFQLGWAESRFKSPL